MSLVLLFIALLTVRPAVAQSSGDEPVLRARSLPPSKILFRVDPEYPPVALERRIHGNVRFSVIIGKDGRVERLRLISGHPLLVSAARAALKQWIYEPTILNGKPVRVVTQVTVTFRLPQRERIARHYGRYTLWARELLIPLRDVPQDNLIVRVVACTYVPSSR